MVKISRLKDSKKALAICLVLAVIIVIGIIFIPKAYKYYKHKKYMEKYFSQDEDIKPLKPLWTRNSGKEFTYKFKIKECDGEYTIKAQKDGDDITYCYQKDGKQYNPDLSSLFINLIPDTITGIKASDIDFDGYTDLIITGTVASKSMFWLRFGYENSSYDDNSNNFTEFQQLQGQKNLDEARMDNLIGANVTVDDVEDWFVGNHKNGEFESYSDAYKKVIDLYEYANPGEFTYKLINFDDDDIPELVADQCDYYGVGHLYVFNFKSGYLSKIVDGWHYGGNANNEYKYNEKSNLIIEVYGAEPVDSNSVAFIDSCYGVIDGKMNELYHHDDDDKAKLVYNEKLTKEQRDALKVDSHVAGYETLEGEYSCEEIFQQLDISGFEVEKIDGSSATFNFAGKEFHYEVENLKNNKKAFYLADGTSSTKKILKCDYYKVFLFNRDDKAYLYLFLDDKDNQRLYIYNLNNKSIKLPFEYYLDKFKCKDDIKSADGFTMLSGINIEGLGNYKTKKEFYVGINGIPIEKDEYRYFIKSNSKDDDSSNNKFGDAIVLNLDLSRGATKDLSKDDIYYSENYPEDGVELVSFKKGTKFYLYKFYNDNVEPYYLVNEDGYMIQIDRDEGFLFERP